MITMYWRELIARVGQPLFALILLVLFMPIVSTAPSAGYISRIPSLVSFFVSIISSIGLYIALEKMPRNRLRRLVVTTWFVFIALAFLEGLGLKPAFDTVRDMLYAASGRGVYEAADRDIALYGRIRSTVFASEPSFLANTLSVLMFMAYVLHPQPKSWRAFLQYLAMATVSYLLAASFTYGFFLIALLIWSFWPKNVRELATLLLTSLLAIGAAFLLRDELTYIFLDVSGNHMATGSFFGRILVAPQAAFETLMIYPLVGVGIGNGEAARPFIVQIWSDSGAFALFPWFNNPMMRAQDLMSSGFWWQWMYLGIAGGVVFNLALFWALRRLRVMYPLRSIVCCWIIWYPGAAFVDVGSWVILTIVSLSSTGYVPRKSKIAGHIVD
ncbi:MAG: hypothetical protein U1A24_03635 [Cypionkella sp.]|uniref:hypothetical protein n=1 Tax=Cypionkella sp. TaxID=2811411 RepID=UPI002ABCE7B8|nr:hypothetical protein [Cypionkella sp.]MDZ4309636.1 hypothetical protein [Cypionkella sp.]